MKNAPESSISEYLKVLEDALLFVREKQQCHLWRTRRLTRDTSPFFDNKRCRICGVINLGSSEEGVCFGNPMAEYAIDAARYRRAVSIGEGMSEERVTDAMWCVRDALILETGATEPSRQEYCHAITVRGVGDEARAEADQLLLEYFKERPSRNSKMSVITVLELPLENVQKIYRERTSDRVLRVEVEENGAAKAE